MSKLKRKQKGETFVVPWGFATGMCLSNPCVLFYLLQRLKWLVY